VVERRAAPAGIDGSPVARGCSVGADLGDHGVGSIAAGVRHVLLRAEVAGLDVVRSGISGLDTHAATVARGARETVRVVETLDLFVEAVGLEPTARAAQQRRSQGGGEYPRCRRGH
jgi:hypothetical protein